MTTTTPPPLPADAPASGVTYHRWAGFDDLPGMTAANGRLRAHVGLLEPVDVDAMRHVYTHLVNSDPVTDCVIVRRHGETVGYARTEWQNLTDGERNLAFTVVLDPDSWGLGLAGELTGWVEARLRETAAALSSDRRAWFATYVFDGDTELEGALLARGYAAVRWDAEMLRDSMDGIPPVPALPDGYAIRPATVDRLEDVGGMLVEAFREHWGESEHGEDEIRDWIENPRFDIDLVTVVWCGDAPAACVSSQLQERQDGVIGYVDAVATHPDHRRLGLARAALLDSLHRLAARGVDHAYLGVDTDNQNRAFALYEDAGFRRVSGSATYRKPFEGQESTS